MFVVMGVLKLYTSPNIIRVIKWRKTGWMVHVACIGVRNAYVSLVGKPEVKRPTTWNTYA